MLQLTSAPRVRRYELTYLIPASFTSTETTQLDEALLAVAKKQKLSVISQEDWGRKELAYPIRHGGKPNTQAVYKHWVLEGDAQQAQSFERDFYLQQDILRHLFVIAEQKQSEPAPSQERGAEAS